VALAYHRRHGRHGDVHIRAATGAVDGRDGEHFDVEHLVVERLDVEHFDVEHVVARQSPQSGSHGEVHTRRRGSVRVRNRVRAVESLLGSLYAFATAAGSGDLFRANYEVHTR